MTIQISKVLMPKACFSCQAFCPKGYAEDQHSPFITNAVKPITAYLLPKFAPATSKNLTPMYLQ